MSRGATLAERARLLAPTLRVFGPEGPGPAPVALLFHGCGGVRPFLDDYARDIAQAGVAAVIVDSLGPRGISRRLAPLTVCTGLRLRGSERAGDLFALLDWLKGQPWADATRVAACGWSHGGWTVMDAFAMGENAERITGVAGASPAQLAAVKTVIVVYPYAAFPSLTSARGWGPMRLPIHAVLAGRDQVVGVKHPQLALDRLKADGLPVDVLMLPDATHAFEDDGANDPRSRFRPDLARRSEAYVTAALKAHL